MTRTRDWALIVLAAMAGLAIAYFDSATLVFGALGAMAGYGLARLTGRDVGGAPGRPPN